MSREKTTTTAKPNRFMELEVLRGTAAVVVSLFHFFALFYPVIALATVVFHRYIESPFMKAATYFEQAYSGDRQVDLTSAYIKSKKYVITNLYGRRPKSQGLPEVNTEVEYKYAS